MLETAPHTQVETSPEFDRFWLLSLRSLQVLLAIFLVAALAGLFGTGGWFATTTVRVGQFDVTYERFARRSVPFRIHVRSAEPARSAQLRLTVGRALIDRTGMVRTIPEAVSSTGSAGAADFIFSQQLGKLTDIILVVQPSRPGWFDWTFEANGSGEVRLPQIIYP